MKPRYRVTLTLQERDQLAALTKDGSTNGKRFLYARALLLCDQGPHGPNWTVARVAEALGVATRTIERLKQRFVEEGLAAALQRKPRHCPPRQVTFDGAFEGASDRTRVFTNASRGDAVGPCACWRTNRWNSASPPTCRT